MGGAWGLVLAFLLRLLFPPVHHIYSFLASRYGSIEPMDIVRREHIVGHVALVDIYVRPLSALRLVAGYGVCVFYLDGVEIGIFPYGFHAVSLSGYVGIVLFYSLKRALLCSWVRAGASD